ncbi:MAG: hypothetical protein FJZ00_01995 [Candidatus Sericytochromatia bacterium]|uniref:HAMP domain-containing protein n=1 Tax=Candidatus Tanganyikabacteria bacterium TaxID=2961651 RepID=A0A937X0S4_9BACT|nr:hypothetical protein [Candidatus Tanganyikabacteria bacterium]
MRRRQLFFAVISALAMTAVIALVLIFRSTRRDILDPLTDLTSSARRIEQGDFTAAHQTLRDDEIGRPDQLVREDGAGPADSRARAGDGLE